MKALNDLARVTAIDAKAAEPAGSRRGSDFELSSAQTTRLAALGFMVAGVCHEVANPLTAIHTMVQLLQSTSPLSPELFERGLANIASNVERVLTITRKLNDFSRTSPDQRSELLLDEPIEQALQALAQEPLFRHVEIAHLRNPELSVFGVRDQLAQVYANIFVNAAQAMEGSGRLTIESCRLETGDVSVSIRDTGPGIAPGHLPRLFEPFFTTKPAGSGTGLGLAISNEIVLEHGGSLYAENDRSGGACFRVQLPTCERARAA
jgi:C4-dicarboxylate-specific signal transduction histidine kinase